jgi:Protein of unknown function (DUF3617)
MVAMNFLKLAVLAAIVLVATLACPAQQKFPLRAGEWEATMPSGIPNQPPLDLLYCLNDELWTKALTQNPSCSVSQLSVSLTGARYHMDCPFKAFQMKGDIEMSFDGTAHMTATGSIDLTMNGKTSRSVSHTDYRWKGPACNPSVDLNLKVKAH